MIKNYETIVVADGEYPKHPIALRQLQNAQYIIACDGAAKKLLQHNIMPQAIVGDLDSLAPTLKKHYAHLLHHQPDQETNDLTKAVQFAYQKGVKRLLILGATGLREDHTLGNLSLLASYSTLFDEVEMLTNYALISVMKKSSTFESKQGMQVSIFSLTPPIEITTQGLRYPITHKKLQFWWEGTLNEALSQHFEITLSGEGTLLIFREI